MKNEEYGIWNMEYGIWNEEYGMYANHGLKLAFFVPLGT